MTDRLDFDRDGKDWPNRETSRFVTANGLRFHVQIAGKGPVMLLLHGTGASTHSWRGLLPLLSRHFTVIAPDLPGHGFTGDPGTSGLSINGMARSIRALLNELKLEPVYTVGHSAGAAILIRMTLHKQITPQSIISLNGALMPFGGLAGQFFAPVARLFATLPLMTSMFAWRARDPRVIDDILKQTGSKLDAEGVALYRRLAGNGAHISAALGMMANWDLHTLQRDLPRLRTPLVLVAGLRDEMVKPSQSQEVKRRLHGARLVNLPGLGHLAHEENAALVADLICSISEEYELAPPEKTMSRKLATQKAKPLQDTKTIMEGTRT
jgi:magnesium chelatase accessory protein